MFSKAFSGENLFQNIYTARGEGSITFGSSFPGQILAMNIQPGQDLILQKSAFLASEVGVQLSIHFSKRFSTGLFGGVVPEKLRTLDHGRPWSDDQFASTRLSSNRDMSR